ncbi:hypothetical protein [Alteribacillus sp. HJP-4]|uniref:hypothetical protein n=1 Tax=Alteribacillus sp. HJP-4 TaxID=2775394 RepID=UPI0035CD0729
MYFPKLEIIKTNKYMNDYLVNKFDSWLATQSEMYSDYLNPFSFIQESNIDKKLGLLVFALAASEEYFTATDPLLKIKYLVDCPNCLNNYKTYFDRKEIPNTYVGCETEECDDFNPSQHPERINIFFERLEKPIIKDDDALQIYEKVDVSPLTYADEDFEKCMWKLEEKKGL